MITLAGMETHDLTVDDIVDLEQALSVVCKCLFVDPAEASVEMTPRRAAKYLLEFSERRSKAPEDLSEVLGTSFSHQAADQMVVQAGIPVRALCEHHLLPIMGTAAVGYIPRKCVVGLSKLARLVDVAGHRRPTMQERLTDDIADALWKHKVLEPSGVIVIVRAFHTCMSFRGIRAEDTYTTTSAIRGIFRNVPAARAEFLSLVAMHSPANGLK